MRHGEVSRAHVPALSPSAPSPTACTPLTWTSPPFQELFDRHIPEWRRDNLYLRYAIGIPLHEIRQGARTRQSRTCSRDAAPRPARQLDRVAPHPRLRAPRRTYKRAELLFSDPDRLQHDGRSAPARSRSSMRGKAHPADEEGKAIIRSVFERRGAASTTTSHVSTSRTTTCDWGRLLTSGVDVWLNTPLQPHEASGTSGMKAALNGVPSFSVLDGWWIEGHIEGITGWSIGDGRAAATIRRARSARCTTSSST